MKFAGVNVFWTNRATSAIHTTFQRFNFRRVVLDQGQRLNVEVILWWLLVAHEAIQPHYGALGDGGSAVLCL